MQRCFLSLAAQNVHKIYDASDDWNNESKWYERRSALQFACEVIEAMTIESHFKRQTSTSSVFIDSVRQLTYR